MQLVFRAIGAYLFLLILLRVMGKKELSQLTAFELILVIVIGDILQQGVTQEDFSLTGALIAASTMGLLVVAASYLSFRWSPAKRVLDGVPIVIVQDGRLLEEVATIERLDRSDVIAAAREKGIPDLAQVKVGVLEPDGKFSFLTEEPPEQQPDEDRHDG